MTTTELILFFFNILWYAIFAAGLCGSLNRRFSWRTTVLILAVCGVSYTVYGIFFEFSNANSERSATVLRLLIALLAYFLPAVILFRDKWYKSLFVSATCFFIQLASDLLAVTLLIPREILNAMSMAELPPTLETVQVLMTTALILPLTWLFTMLMRRRRNQLAPAEWVLFFAFPLSQMVLLSGWQFAPLSELNVNRVLVMALGIGLSIAADGLLFLAVQGMAQRRKLAVEKKLLEQQVELQKKHYAALTEQYEDLRRMRHDIANHLETMKALLENGAHKEASSYTEEMVNAFRFRSRLGNCENPVADAFLMAKVAELKQQGCVPELRVAVPQEVAIANSDLVAAFGNLLDNVAEACAEGPDKHFTLSASVSRGFLTIRTENAARPEKAPPQRRIRELPRGIGQQILSDLAEKYDGSFRVDEGNGVYISTLILNTEAGHAADRDL